MGWLWTCLGYGPTVQAHKLCSDKTREGRNNKSLRGRVNKQPNGLRVHQLPTQPPRNVYGTIDNSQWRAGGIGGNTTTTTKSGCVVEPEGGLDSFKIPSSSVSTCISINTLKKASEASFGTSFRSELGFNLRSDVDELKEELAALRRRLASEEAEARKLREEVSTKNTNSYGRNGQQSLNPEISHLRSCGVLQESEDALDVRKSQNLSNSKDNPFLRYTEALEQKQRQIEGATTKQLRKCFSGSMVMNESSSYSREVSGIAARSTNSSEQARISSHCAGFSPKPQSLLQEAKEEVNPKAKEELKPKLAEETAPRKSSASQHEKIVENESSLSLAAWIGQAATDARHAQGQQSAAEDVTGPKSYARTAAESIEIQWIEVQSAAPCPSSSSTNVKKDLHTTNNNKDKDTTAEAESPRMPKGEGLTNKDSQRPGGKRRQRRTSGDHNSEPAENSKRPKDQPPLLSISPNLLLPEQVEAQLSHAVAAFKQQRLELDAKHQSLCTGQTIPATTNSEPVVSNVANVVGLFRNSRKKSLAIRSRGFRRALSPVKEALSIEESLWGRQSGNIKDFVTPIKYHGTLSYIIEQSVETANSLEPSPVKVMMELKEQHQNGNLNGRSNPWVMSENTDFVPVQCASPSLSPKKRAASSALDALCSTLMVTQNHNNPKGPHVGRYDVEDSVEGTLWNDDEDDEDDNGADHLKPIECASPSFSPRRKNSRGSVPQAVISSLEPEDITHLLVSSTESQEEKCTPEGANKSPNLQLAVAPFREWTSVHENMEFHPATTDRNWYSDAIDAIKSINDIRSSKERRLTEGGVSSKENSPGGKNQMVLHQMQQQQQQQQQQNPPSVRPPQCSSAERKILRRAFSWYVAESDERIKACETTKERQPRKKSQDWEELEEKVLQNSSIPNRNQAGNQTAAGKGPLRDQIRADISTDSGETATFSIDLNRADSPPQENSANLDAADSKHASSMRPAARQPERAADKENRSSRESPASSKKRGGSRTPDKFPSPSEFSQYIRRSLDISPENRPIMGSVAVHWENMHPSLTPKPRITNSTSNYEDDKVEWRVTPFEERVERALHKQPDVSLREQMNRRFSSQLTDYILTGHKVGSTAQR